MTINLPKNVEDLINSANAQSVIYQSALRNRDNIVKSFLNTLSKLNTPTLKAEFIIVEGIINLHLKFTEQGIEAIININDVKALMTFLNNINP